jgi:hypothetical protein
MRTWFRSLSDYFGQVRTEKRDSYKVAGPLKTG